ncbi:hypothetical protein [Lysobacter gummosus]|uniref:hypothetical protein n=1 Tax=Lysobacter gummosus TaxID=262324 RepID=UPI0036403866
MTRLIPPETASEPSAFVPAGLVQVLVWSTALVTLPLASVSVVRHLNVAVGSGEEFVHLKLNVSGDAV